MVIKTIHDKVSFLKKYLRSSAEQKRMIKQMLFDEGYLTPPEAYKRLGIDRRRWHDTHQYNYHSILVDGKEYFMLQKTFA
jgi:hypothetical protein